MAGQAFKQVRALQGLADTIATALAARFAITTADGTIVLLAPTTPAGLQVRPAPGYDADTATLCWPQEAGITDCGQTLLQAPDGLKYTLWARRVGKAVDLVPIATLFRHHLSLLHKYQQEVDNLAEQLLETYEEVNLFYQLADAFTTATDESQLVNILLTRALQASSAHGGAVVLFESHIPKVVAAQGELSAAIHAQPLIPFAALEAVLQGGVTRNLGPQKAPGQPDRPTIIAPILIKREPIGAVVLQKQTRTPFGAGEMKVVRSLSVHAGVFLNNLRQAQRLVQAAHLQHQVELAEAVQRQLLPASNLLITGMDIAAAYRANDQVGGDYYDVFDIAPHLVGAVVADVSGHSLASGLLMTAARSAVRLLVRYASQPAEILRQLNATLYSDLDQTDLFLSICLVVIDRQAQVVRYANAGHNPGLLYAQSTGTVMPLDATGYVIGFAPEADFEECEQPFYPGDTLVLYTDGVIESRSPQGEFFGEPRLQHCVREIGNTRAHHIVGAIMTDVCQHAHNQLTDDTTLLVLKRAVEG